MQDKKLKKIKRLADYADRKEFAIFDELESIDDSLEEKESEIEELESEIEELDSKVSEMEETNTEEHKNIQSELARLEEEKLSMGQIEALKPILKGKDGKDYVLTEKDKKDIAKTINVPIVEKIIEKVEVIKEQPIVTEVTKEIKIENPLTGVEIVDKINNQDTKIKREKVEGLADSFKSLEDRIIAVGSNGKGGGATGKIIAGSNITVENRGTDTVINSTSVDTDEKTKVSANDTTAGYLNGKLVAGAGITLTENNNGGDETLEIINSLSSIVVDTKTTILASTPTSETVAYATDTQQFYVFDGTNWQESSSYFGERNANPNMGAAQDGNVNDIGRDFIANKRLSQIKLGGYSEELDSTFKSKGAIKGEDNEDTGDYEMSMWSTVSQTWRRFLAGISLRNDTPNQTLVSDDFSYFTMDLFTGDSLEVDFYGTPMVQWGKISMGAIQPPVTLSGGQF